MLANSGLRQAGVPDARGDPEPGAALPNDRGIKIYEGSAGPSIIYGPAQ